MSTSTRSTSGHLYVVSFANGMVKVGRAAKVASRILTHTGEAQRHGNAVVEYWMSPVIERFDVAETALIQWCEAQPGAVACSGREWFTGLDFAATVEESKRLCVPGVAGRIAEEQAEQARIKVERLALARAEQSQRVTVSAEYAAHELRAWLESERVRIGAMRARIDQEKAARSA